MLDDTVLANDWYVVARSKDLEEDALQSVRVLGEDLVLWRHDGEVHAWKDLCIHRGAQLSKGWVKDGTVVCPYHGWRYNCEGRCVHIPAAPNRPPPRKARTFVHHAKERYGYVWVSMGEPEEDVPPFPEWDDPTFRNFHAGPYHYAASGFRAVENFLDATHFPFVHAGLNGVPDNPDTITDYEVYRGPEGLSTSEVQVFQPYGDHRQVPIYAGYTYRCMRPLTAYFSKRCQIADPETKAKMGSDNDRFCTFLTATPVDDVNCIVWLAIAINYGEELTEKDILKRQDVVFSQDRAIVETQRPERLPLDLKEELHLRSDKLGLEYRRWLGELGVRVGAA